MTLTMLSFTKCVKNAKNCWLSDIVNKYIGVGNLTAYERGREGVLEVFSKSFLMFQPEKKGLCSTALCCDLLKGK